MIARALSFEDGAHAYDAYRPGYPQELLDDVLDFAGDGTAHEAPEVGAGTGKLTRPLARRGLRVAALEPVENRARVLRANADRAGVGALVTVRVTAFEQVDPGEGPYGLVVAVQSFHWTDPDTRWARLVELLAPDGAAAMFWTHWSLAPAANDVDGIREVYRHHGPDLTPDLARSGPNCWPADEIEATPGLVDPIERSYGWEWNLPAARYLRFWPPRRSTPC